MLDDLCIQRPSGMAKEDSRKLGNQEDVDQVDVGRLREKTRVDSKYHLHRLKNT